jgi:hypothetical protein
VREVRKGRDGAEDLLWPPDEARLIQPHGRPNGQTLPSDYRLGERLLNDGQGVLDRRVELAGPHRLEEALADLERLQATVVFVA